MENQSLKSKKITLATVKKFIKESEQLFLEKKSAFDGMTDCVEEVKSQMQPIHKENAIGINGAYCVGSSRDLFTYVETNTHFGIEVYNCCGCSILWTLKN